MEHPTELQDGMSDDTGESDGKCSISNTGVLYRIDAVRYFCRDPENWTYLNVSLGSLGVYL